MREALKKHSLLVTCPIRCVRYTTFHVRVFQNKTNLLNYQIYDRNKKIPKMLQCNQFKLEMTFEFLLSTNQQLHNLKRFCVGKCCIILGFDPTFNICNYNVTMSIYRHPLLIDKATEEHPVLIGPSLFYSHKSFQSCFLLPSNMV